MTTNKFDLDTPVLNIPDQGGKQYPWTIRSAIEGLQVMGGIGSGKTSGSGRTIALKYLSLGFGGLVLTAKPGEKEDWQEYCRLAGRTDDLVVIEPGGKEYFDFLGYESHTAEGEQSYVDNIVQVLRTVLKASEEKSRGKGDDAFWESAIDMLLFHIIDLCQLAYDKVTVKSLYDIARHLPKPSEKPPVGQDEAAAPRYTAFDKAFIAAQKNVEAKLETFRQSLPAGVLHSMDKEQFGQLAENGVPELRRMNQIDHFFFELMHDLSSKTRAVIDFSFLGLLFRMMQEPLYSLFCGHASTVTPEDCYTKGKILLINLPVKKYHKAGRDAQILIKYIWQRAMEKRPRTDNMRPVFLWADEAQNFLHEYDADYQATARSSCIATVYISQNMANYYANMGGEKSEFRVKSFLGTLSTKLFHANADIETNRYASELIGEAYQQEQSTGMSIAGSLSANENTSWVLRSIVRPEELMSLKTGSKMNSYKVTGYIHVQGRSFANGFNHRLLSFDQNYKP